MSDEMPPRKPQPTQRAEPAAPTFPGYRKLSAELIDALFDAVSKGSTLSQACAHVDIDKTTVWRWRNVGAAERRRRAEGGEPDPRHDLQVSLVARLEQAEPARIPQLANQAHSMAFERQKEFRRQAKQVECPQCHYAGATERTVTEIERPASEAMVRFLLERLGGPQWQRRDHLDVGYDPAQLLVDFQSVLDGVEAFIAEHKGREFADEVRRDAARLLRERAVAHRELESA